MAQQDDLFGIFENIVWQAILKMFNKQNIDPLFWLWPNDVARKKSQHPTLQNVYKTQIFIFMYNGVSKLSK